MVDLAEAAVRSKDCGQDRGVVDTHSGVVRGCMRSHDCGRVGESSKGEDVERETEG